jgi:hypothetical protein
MVGDNDVMFHRVEAVGAEQDGSIVPMDSLLQYDATAEQWDIAKAWRTDSAGRGVGLPDSGDPLHDPAFVSAVTSAYAGTVRRGVPVRTAN